MYNILPMNKSFNCLFYANFMLKAGNKVGLILILKARYSTLSKFLKSMELIVIFPFYSFRDKKRSKTFHR